MAAEANIKAVITAEDRASGVLSNFGGALGVAKAGALGLLAGLTAVAAGATVAVKSFSESENASAQLGAVLKSTGGAAGVTADAALNLAKSLQATTTFSDEAVLGAENLLLTFTSIGKDIFPQATKTVLDMSTALGQDTKSSAIQLGKALQDPILGVTALRRVGVNFNEAQQDVIKNLVETGRSAEAQQLILAELNKEFGGSAVAAASTFTGQLTQMKNVFDDILEVVGGVVANALRPLIQAVLDWTSAAGGADGIGRMLTGAIASLGGAFGVLMQVFSFLKPSLDALWVSFSTQLVPAMVDLWVAIQPLLPIIGVTLVAAIYVAINALTIMVRIWTTVLDVITAVATFFLTTLPQSIGAGIGWIVERVTYLKNHFWETVGFIIGFFATLPIRLPMYAIAALTAIINFVAGINWGGIFSGIWHAMENVWNTVKNSAIGAFNYLKGLNWGSIASGVASGVANSIIGMIEGAINGAISGVPGVGKVSLPRFASGVTNFSGGLAVVGERGKEVVSLPAGSSVTPNHALGQIGGGSTVNITVQAGAYMGNPADAREYARLVVENIKDIASAKSMSPMDLLT